MTETKPSCRWAGADQPRLLRTHFVGCEKAACDGCAPCPERHCVACGRTHVPETALRCPSCVGDVRENLGQIAALSAYVLGEATVRGVNSEAAMLAGPAADPEVWARRHRLVVNAALGTEDRTSAAHRALVAWMEDCRDELHPLWVLGTWDMLVTEHYGHDRTRQVTIVDAAGYLGRNLTDLAADPDFAFEQLATEVRQCRGHLEDVLHDGVRDERGAPCPACREKGADRAPALVRVYGDDAHEDGFTCPRCKSHWSEADYRLRVGADYLAEADRLTAPDIERQYRVPAGTVRVWAQRKRVAKRGRDESGRQLYDVADVVTMREGREPTRAESDA